MHAPRCVCGAWRAPLVSKSGWGSVGVGPVVSSAAHTPLRPGYGAQRVCPPQPTPTHQPPHQRLLGAGHSSSPGAPPRQPAGDRVLRRRWACFRMSRLGRRWASRGHGTWCRQCQPAPCPARFAVCAGADARTSAACRHLRGCGHPRHRRSFERTPAPCMFFVSCLPACCIHQPRTYTMAFHVGAYVTICRMNRRDDLNGQIGIVESFNPRTQR